MAANNQKSCFTLKHMAGQLQEVSAVLAQVPTHPAVTGPHYGTEKHLRFMHMPAQKHMQREKIPWVSHTEMAPTTLFTERVTAAFSLINKQHALWQDHHYKRIACFHLHLYRLALAPSRL